MTEREQFEAWVDRDKINNCHPMEAALIAWQAARATPADHSSLTTEEIQLAVKVWRERRTRMPDIAVQEAFTDGLAAASALFKRRATPADQEPVGKNWQERVQLRMLSMPENPNAPDVIGPVYNPVEVELRAVPADHSASLTSYAPVDRSLLAWAKQLPLRSVSASSIAEIKFLLDHFEATRNAAPQTPKNAADHIEAQSVRDTVIEECAKVIDSYADRALDCDPQFALDLCSDAVRDLKSAPPQKPVSDEVKP